MTTQQTAALDKLREQQSGVREHTAPWMVAQQLMDICRHDPASAELILQDLDRPAMSIVEAEKKVKAYFIRRAKAPRKSFYTLELNEGKLVVRQNRGRRNCARTKEVEELEAVWLAWLKAGAPRDAKGRPVVPEQSKQKEVTAA